ELVCSSLGLSLSCRYYISTRKAGLAPLHRGHIPSRAPTILGGSPRAARTRRPILPESQSEKLKPHTSWQNSMRLRKGEIFCRRNNTVRNTPSPRFALFPTGLRPRASGRGQGSISRPCSLQLDRTP